MSQVKRVQCKNRHFYDAARFAQCPVCGQQVDGKSLKELENKNDPIDPDITVELPKSSGVDELAPTMWIPPEKILAFFGSEVDPSVPQPVSELIEEELPLEEKNPPAVPVSSEEDENIPAVQSSPDSNMRMQDDPPVTADSVETNPEESQFVEIPLEEIKSEEINSDVDNSSENGAIESEFLESEDIENAPAIDESAESDKTEAVYANNMVAQALEETADEDTREEIHDLSGILPVESLSQDETKSHIAETPTSPWITAEHMSSAASLPVGWIIGLNGTNKGKLFPCKSGKNLIGSGHDMDIVLPEEISVNQDTHALIIYEPKKRQFFVQAGTRHGLTYLNDELVFTHNELHRYDRITFGEAEFVFVPLCGEHFSWDPEPNGR